MGEHRCPNPACRTLVFIVWGEGKGILACYPGERIDFDATNLPQRVLATLEEAITCHANRCYTAAGIMVRKTLEELCHDQGATGNTLKLRIDALKTKAILPQELFDGLDDLRLLGNDAAHIDAQVYQQIGQEEVEVAVDVTKEILKAVFQYGALLDKLRGLKKQGSTSGPATGP
jgi:Domain of unknown function (DUF4145)